MIFDGSDDLDFSIFEVKLTIQLPLRTKSYSDVLYTSFLIPVIPETLIFQDEISSKKGGWLLSVT